MNNKQSDRANDESTTRAGRFWYSVLTSFPFIYLPIVAAIGILCSLLLPFLTGAKR